jgi:hypothetical protein
MKKRILIVTIAYRVGERMYPTIPKLSKQYTIDVLRVYQMHPNFKWPGTFDMRNHFENCYNEYVNKVFFEKEKIDYSSYDLIIYDDCRTNNGGDWIYQQAKCPVISCSHGNGDNMYKNNINKVFDKLFLFGRQEITESYIHATGIPSNDNLKNYLQVQKQHILVIINFLGNHEAPFTKFNKDSIDSMNLLELQKLYNLPIVFKLKSRHNNGSAEKDQSYLRSLLPKELQFKIIIDTTNDNLLIAESALVLGAPSTLMCKSLQLKIPTLMFSGYGQTGIFKNYVGLIKLKSDTFFTYIDDITSYKIQDEYIENLIEGGTTFNSTDIFINNINKVI